MQTPNQTIRGIRSRSGTMPARSAFPLGAKRGAERPLLAQFPGSLYLRFGFRNVPMPNPLPAIGTAAAYYGLASWRVPDDLGQQAALVGYRIEIGPNDATAPIFGEFGAAGSAWGSKDGSGGALVIGLDLGSKVGQFSEAPNVPFTTVWSAGNQCWAPQNAGQVQVFHCPPGSFDNDPYPRAVYINQTTPLALLLPSGAQLDVAFVFRKGDMTTAGAGADPGFRGFCYGELIVAQTITQGEFIE